MARKKTKRTTREALEKAMLAELKKRGMTQMIYTDKVQEYLDFWERRQQLHDDIATRGLIVLDERGRQSENRSISLEVQVSRQMMSILQALGFKPDDLKGAGSDDEDDL